MSTENNGAQPTGQPPQDQKPPAGTDAGAAGAGADAGKAAPAQAPTLENLTAAQIKELYTKSPDLFKEVIPPQDPAKQEPPKETKPPVPPAQGAADDLKLELPKEAQVDPEVIKEFVSLAKENGFNSKQANAAVAFYMKLNDKAHAANRASFEGWRKQNEATLKADPEFGKDFEANKAIAQKPLEKYGDPELAKALAESGWENHPLLAKFLHKIGKAMSEDSTRPPRPVTRELNSDEKALRARYPSMFPKEATEA